MRRSLIFTLLLFIIAITFGQTAFSQTAFGKTNTPNDGFDISLTIESEHLNEARQIRVKLPEDYQQSKSLSYPVLYLLDGQKLQRNSAFIHDFLAGKKHIPQMIIVSIPDTGQRTRDYNTFFRDSGKINPGADHFLSFLEKELIPTIDSTYRTTSYRLLAGHSQAGLFVFHSLIKRPDLFKARFAFSPSSHHIPKQRVLLQDFLKTHKNLAGFFYSNVGGTEFYQMTDAFANTRQIFEAHAAKGLRYHFDFHEVDGHQSSPFIGQHLAFKQLYAPLKLANDYDTMSAKQIITHYDNISAEFGYEVKPTERDLSNQESYYVRYLPDLAKLQVLYTVINHYYPQSKSLASNQNFLKHWFKQGADQPFYATGDVKPQPDLLNTMGYSYALKNELKQALYLLKLATQLYPELSNPYDSYAEVLEQSGDFKAAAKLYSQAYDIGIKKQEDPKLIAIYLGNLQRATALMQ